MKPPNITHVLKRISNRGFTLVETFIAVSILMVVIVGPLTLAQRSLSSASLTKEKMTAYFLAQDVIEYIRNIRDDANLANPEGGGWAVFTGVIAEPDNEVGIRCAGGPGDDPQCVIDTTTKVDAVTHCEWDSCPNINYNKNQSSDLFGSYSYATGADWETSPFKVGVRVGFIPSDWTSPDLRQEIAIKVVVEWQSQGFGIQEVVLRDTLLNW